MLCLRGRALGRAQGYGSGGQLCHASPAIPPLPPLFPLRGGEGSGLAARTNTPVPGGCSLTQHGAAGTSARRSPGELEQEVERCGATGASAASELPAVREEQLHGNMLTAPSP